jgi:hypothetical protein
MGVQLNTRAFNHAKARIAEKHVVHDERGAWSEHQPSTEQENRFIESHGLEEYGKWHLAFDDQQPKDTKQRYKFPYGDFKKVHRCAVIAAESRAGQYKYFDVEDAAAQLHGMIDGESYPVTRHPQRATRV